MFEQTQKDFIRNLLDKNPLIQVDKILNALQLSGLSTSKTKKQSYNRALNEVLKEDGIIITRENPKTKDTVIKTEDGISKITDEEFARDDFIDRDDDDDGIWYKKLLKTGTTTENKWGKTSLKIEIYTYEKNDKCRFDSLLDAVISKVPEVQYIDDGGYSSSRDSSGEFSPFQFESAYLVVKTSETSTFYDGAVTLTDTNETPC